MSQAHYEVLAVRHGLFETRRSDFYLNYGEYGQPDAPLELAYWFWVIRGGGRTIVVDSGYSADGAARRKRTVILPVAEALAALGIGPRSDVDVVVTHAHYDHIGNLDLFPIQRFFISPEESAFWLGAESRHRQFQSVVEDADLVQLERLVASGRAQFVVGRREIAPGVVLHPFPGHTPGQLVVTVETAHGRIVLASDACHLSEELDRDMPFKHNTDLIGLYRGLEQLRRWRDAGDLIIPGHEPSTLEDFACLDGPLAEHAVRIA